MPRRTSEATTTKIAFITRSGIITLIRMSQEHKKRDTAQIGLWVFHASFKNQLCSTTDGRSRLAGQPDII